MANSTTAITQYRGDSWPFIITLRDKLTGDPLPITGYTFILTVDRKLNPTDETTKLFSVAGTIVDPDAGTVRFFPSAANHATTGKFFYDVQMSYGASQKKTVVKDSYNIEQDISK
jgi:hypothetical protein